MQQDANVVRLDASQPRVLIPFPEARVLRARVFGDQVAVIHGGETTIYENPQALAEAFREHDPEAFERLRSIDASVVRARQLVDLAEAREAEARAQETEAKALFARAERALATASRAHGRALAFGRKLKGLALLGAALALFFIVALGSL